MVRQEQQLGLKLRGGRTKSTHGGRRKGAGRPNLTGLQGHGKRPRLSDKHPVHVTLRLKDGLPSTRRKDVFAALRGAVRKAWSDGFRVAHFALISNHLHFLIEPRSNKELTRALQSLEISFAKRLNRAAGRKGAVFADRYHVRTLATPTEARNALAYVLSNESRHKGLGLGTYFISPYSSGHAFDEWPALFGRKYRFVIATRWSLEEIEAWLAEIVAPPRTWMLRAGWRRGKMAEGGR